MKKLISVIFIVGLISIAWVWASYQNTLNQELNLNDSELVYAIKPGSSLSAVIYDLYKKKIIFHPRYLLWYARLNGLSNEMQAGDYLLTGKLKTIDFLNNIFTGKVIQYSFTVIEGWSFKQLLEELKKHPHIKHTINNLSAEEVMDKLQLSGIHFEGQFLPDTYLFPSQLTDLEFLKRAYKSMQKILKQEWDKRAADLPYKTPYEALIMASIIEKETGQASERKQIAGVFVRRLQKRMRLQTDPTVIYGMGEQYKGNIRKRDLYIDTPYNTYTRKGLPPSPIALPGQDAIHAALHPAAGDALFFVSRGDGTHVFSATVTEHNRAVCKYQKKGRNCKY